MLSLYLVLFIIYSRAAALVSLPGSQNFISAVSSKGGKSTDQSYHKVGVSEFYSYKSEQVTTAGSCAILCLKEGVENCNGFLIKDGAEGKLDCTLGVSLGLFGNDEIYLAQVETQNDIEYESIEILANSSDNTKNSRLTFS